MLKWRTLKLLKYRECDIYSKSKSSIFSPKSESKSKVTGSCLEVLFIYIFNIERKKFLYYYNKFILKFIV